jgi:hypothetical protein
MNLTAPQRKLLKELRDNPGWQKVKCGLTVEALCRKGLTEWKGDDDDDDDCIRYLGGFVRLLKPKGAHR